VTRLRAPYDAGAAVTSPAVEADGTLVVGVNANSNQLRGLRPDGSVWQQTLQIPGKAAQPVLVAPAVGQVDLFAASEDNRLYRWGLDGMAPVGPTLRSPTSTDTVLIPFSPLTTPTLHTVGPTSVDHA
jgi:hypothetical protein